MAIIFRHGHEVLASLHPTSSQNDEYIETTSGVCSRANTICFGYLLSISQRLMLLGYCYFLVSLVDLLASVSYIKIPYIRLCDPLYPL